MHFEISRQPFASLRTRNRVRTKTFLISSKGFTLVELLVVIVIVAILVSLAFTFTQRAKLSATKAADMSRLRGLAAASMAAGEDNNGVFPLFHATSSNFPYYLAERTILESYGISKESCYTAVGTDMGGAPTYNWWYGFGTGGTPVHFCYLGNDAKPGGRAWFKGGKTVVPDRKDYRGAMDYDEIIKNPDKAYHKSMGDDAWYDVIWTGICRETGGKQVAGIMKDGKAVGINQIFVDGHGEWVDFKKMKARYVVGSYSVYW